MNMQPLVLAMQNAVPPRDIGVATSSATFFRQIGGTLGTAVFLSVLFSTVGGKITDAFARAAQTPQFQAALKDPAVLANPANQQILQALKSGGTGGADAAGALNDSVVHPEAVRRAGVPVQGGLLGRDARRLLDGRRGHHDRVRAAASSCRRSRCARSPAWRRCAPRRRPRPPTQPRQPAWPDAGRPCGRAGGLCGVLGADEFGGVADHDRMTEPAAPRMAASPPSERTRIVTGDHALREHARGDLGLDAGREPRGEAA